MEADDLLAYEVEVGGPVVLELLLLGWVVGAVAEGGHVVGEGVEPDVDDVLLVVGHGDAPLEAGAGDGEVFEGSGEVGGAFGGPGEWGLRGVLWLAGRNTGILRFAQNDRV